MAKFEEKNYAIYANNTTKDYLDRGLQMINFNVPHTQEQRKNMYWM